MKLNDPKTIAACALALLAANASAEIQMAEQPYQEDQYGRQIEFSIPSAAIPAPVAAPPEIWAVKRSSYLHETMRQWATRAGWSLVWGLGENEDLRMDAGNNFQGDFTTAVSQLFNSFPASVRINAELRPDNSPPLIFINREDGAR